MKCQILAPSPHLQNYVKFFWMLESNSEEEGCSYRSLPDGYIELTFQLKKPWRWGYNNEQPTHKSKTKLVAQFTQNLDLILPEHSKNFYIKLYPWAFYDLFHIPVSEFTNQHLSLDDVFQKETSDLHEQMLACPTLSAIKKIVEPWLTKRLINAQKNAPEAVYLSQLICQKNGIVQVKDLLNDYSRSQRWLQKEFLALTGLTPKYFARIQRNFNTTLLLKKGIPLMDITHQMGYTDQAHFIRDFKHFSGHAPRAYLQSIQPDKYFNNFQV